MEYACLIHIWTLKCENGEEEEEGELEEERNIELHLTDSFLKIFVTFI